MDNIQIPPCIFVIFGGTGDLTHRKLIPALYNLLHQRFLPSNFAVVSVGRRDKTDDEYRNEVLGSLKKYSRFEMDDSLWNEMHGRIFYRKVDFPNAAGYKALNFSLSELDRTFGTGGNRVFYLAVSPDYFETIINNLHVNGMVQKDGTSWQRVVIEKPFGSSLMSARQLNRKIAEVFDERNTYRIDHYLGKEMVQSILGVRFSNAFFEPLWNNQWIDNIQISSCETIGIGSRGEYYDRAGALGDMIQNHMLQILALIAMEPPENFHAESIRDEKVRVLKAMKEFTPSVVAENAVFGQYSAGGMGDGHVQGYREETKVLPESETETFAALKIQLDSPRWNGVPFYIRTGKRLAVKTTDVVIQFKTSQNSFQPDNSGSREPNLLVIKIQPREELYVQFNTKKPGIQGKIGPVKMNYCQKCKICEAETNSPEAYEKLMMDVIQGDSTLFTRWDEVEETWEIIEKIKEAGGKKKNCFPNYAPGTWGPKEADRLLERDGRRWWNL